MRVNILDCQPQGLLDTLGQGMLDFEKTQVQFK